MVREIRARDFTYGTNQRRRLWRVVSSSPRQPLSNNLGTRRGGSRARPRRGSRARDGCVKGGAPGLAARRAREGRVRDTSRAWRSALARDGDRREGAARLAGRCAGAHPRRCGDTRVRRDGALLHPPPPAPRPRRPCLAHPPAPDVAAARGHARRHQRRGGSEGAAHGVWCGTPCFTPSLLLAPHLSRPAQSRRPRRS